MQGNRQDVAMPADLFGVRSGALLALSCMTSLVPLSCSGSLATYCGYSDYGADLTEANGTFSGTDWLGSPVRATIMNAQVSITQTCGGSAGGPPVGSPVTGPATFNVFASPSFSSPPGVTGSIDSSIALTATPTPGEYESAGTDTFGGMTVYFDRGCGADGEPDDYFTACSTGCDCSLPDGGQGSWKLTLTSVTPAVNRRENSPYAFYAVDGTFTATLPDGDGGSGTLQLTF
jgi:hypothetical protein